MSPAVVLDHTVTIAQSILFNQSLIVSVININRIHCDMEDRSAEMVPSIVSPRQDAIQGRPHEVSTVAPITPEIGAVACDFDDIHGIHAVDILEIKDLTTQLKNTPKHEDLLDTIRRLEEENRVLREAQVEDNKEVEESVRIITALQQRLYDERTHQNWKQPVDETSEHRVE